MNKSCNYVSDDYIDVEIAIPACSSWTTIVIHVESSLIMHVNKQIQHVTGRQLNPSKSRSYRLDLLQSLFPHPKNATMTRA
jgi:hypothetical protein